MERRISLLEQDLKKREGAIDEQRALGRPVEASAHAVLSDKYMQLFRLNNDARALHSAIAHINQAMALAEDATEWQYLATRADLYIEVDAYEQAERDIAALDRAMSSLAQPDALRGKPRMYIDSVRTRFAFKYQRRAGVSPQGGGGRARTRRARRSPLRVHPGRRMSPMHATPTGWDAARRVM